SEELSACSVVGYGSFSLTSPCFSNVRSPAFRGCQYSGSKVRLTQFRTSPQDVLSEVMMYSLNRSAVLSISCSAAGKPESWRLLIYFELLATFQYRLFPSNECAEGPIPRYLLPFQ